MDIKAEIAEFFGVEDINEVGDPGIKYVVKNCSKNVNMNIDIVAYEIFLQNNFYVIIKDVVYVIDTVAVCFHNKDASYYNPRSIVSDIEQGVSTLDVYLSIKSLPLIMTYFDTIPRDVLIFIMTKLNIESMHFRKMHPDITSEEIYLVAGIPQSVTASYNKVKEDKKKIFESFDPFGVVLAINSKEEDMSTLEELYPYLKVAYLWRDISIYAGIPITTLKSLEYIRNDITNEFLHRITIKTFYNDIYMRIKHFVVHALEVNEYIKEKLNIDHFNWHNLVSDIHKFDSIHGLFNYSVRSISKGKIEDDSLGIASMNAVIMGTLYGKYPILQAVLGASLGERHYVKIDESNIFDYIRSILC